MNRLFSLLLILSVFSTVSLHASDRVREYFYEMFRLELSGNVNPEYAEEKSSSDFYPAKKTALAFSQTFWTFDHGAVLLVDFLYPDSTALIITDLYGDSYADSGLWIASLLEGSSGDFIIRRPDELLRTESEIESEKLEAEGNEGSEDQSHEIAEGVSIESDNYIPYSAPEPEAEIADRSVRNMERALVFYSYSDEFLSLQNTDERRIIVRGDDNHLFRLYFDESMRITKKEVWNYTKKVDTSSVSYTQDFEYSGDSSIPYRSVIIEEEKNTVLEYDEKGKVAKSEIYVVQEEKKYKDSLTTWKFNSAGKVSEKYFEHYTYRNNKAHSLLSTDSKKEVFEYKVDDKTPDYYYYENNELRMKTEYSSPDSYVSTTYFDGGFMVEAYYKNDSRVKDVFYLNGIVKRIKVYEK